MDETTVLETEPHGSEERPSSGRHPVNIGYLVMGMAFAGLTVIWALIESDAVARDDIRWLLPLPWILAGSAGLLAITLTSRRRRNAGFTG